MQTTVTQGIILALLCLTACTVTSCDKQPAEPTATSPAAEADAPKQPCCPAEKPAPSSCCPAAKSPAAASCPVAKGNAARCCPADATPGVYEVNRASAPITPDADWNKPAWKNIPALCVNNYMGAKPEHIPCVQAKVLYDDSHLYVIFKVEDQYVRAVAKEYQDSVCTDSCTEFFFTPGPDIKAGYFNIEVNCGGTLLFNYQLVPWKNQVKIDPADGSQIKIAATLPKIVDPEITEPITWVVEYSLPIDILQKYSENVAKPAPGVIWRANFYKCADATSKPHWLTWAVVDKPSPNFHVPEFFGQLVFK